MDTLMPSISNLLLRELWARERGLYTSISKSGAYHGEQACVHEPHADG